VIDCLTPADKQVHLIVDYCATHERLKVRRWLKLHRRFRVHLRRLLTEYGERFFGYLVQKCLRRGVLGNDEELMIAIGPTSDILEKAKRPRAALP